LEYRNYQDLSSDSEEEDEENCISPAITNKDTYGSLTITTVKKLTANKLLNFTLINERIYVKILDVYFHNMSHEKENTSSFFKMIKLFMNCIPSLKYINRYACKTNFELEKNKQNIYFLKLCLDLYEDYFKTFDYPLLKNYKKIFLSTAIKFYSKITEEHYKTIFDKMAITMLSLSSSKYILIYNDYNNRIKNFQNEI
jgi:hypothetical protein